MHHLPRQVLHHLLMALHIQLDHHTSHQLKLVVHCFLCALDIDKAIVDVSSKYHHCTSLRSAPHLVGEQLTYDHPAADIRSRHR